MIEGRQGDDVVIRVDFGHNPATCPVCAQIAARVVRDHRAGDHPRALESGRILWVGRREVITPAQERLYRERLARISFEVARANGELSPWRRIGQWLARAWRWIRS